MDKGSEEIRVDEPDFSAFEQLSNPAITKIYLTERAKFRSLTDRADRISRGSGGILSTGNRMFWASILFTRILVTGKSLNRLLPDAKKGEHWDFSAVASLTRNLMEAVFVYQWLCGEGIADEVRDGRFILLYLHDYGSRKRLFPQQFSSPDSVHEKLVQRFDANPYLATFDEKQRKVALKGEKTPFIQDDIISSMGADAEEVRSLYRFFSQHTHTGPIAYYRMHEHDRGAGVETRMEKIYILIALRVAFDFLSHAITVHLAIFPDAETRKPFLTRQQIEANVEVEQGRASRRSGKLNRR
jgi:hypothetical protein